MSLNLDAMVAPLAAGAGLPTGMVTFELMKNEEQGQDAGDGPVLGGSTTLTVKPNRC